MPIIKSAAKRMRQETVRRERNKGFKRSLRDDIRALERAIEAGDTGKIAKALKAAQSSLDKAVKKNLLHKNSASRKMSNLSKKIQLPPVKAKAAPKKAAKTTKATTKKVTKKAKA